MNTVHTANPTLTLCRSAFPRMQKAELPCFLFSGQDALLQSCLLSQILEQVKNQGPLWIVSTLDYLPPLPDFRLVRAEDGCSLGSGLLDLRSPYLQSRLRVLMDANGEGSKASAAVLWLRLVAELERLSGQNRPLTPFLLLEEYSGNLAFTQKLDALGASLGREKYKYLLEKYAELSPAAYALELALLPLLPYLVGRAPGSDEAVVLDLCGFRPEDAAGPLLLLCANVGTGSLLVLDRGSGEGTYFQTLLDYLPLNTALFVLGNDLFSLPETVLSRLMSRLPLHLYGRHGSPTSAARLEAALGQHEIIKMTHTESRDLRLYSATVWDRLLDRDRVQTSVRTPQREAIYKKEELQALPSGSFVASYLGEKCLLCLKQVQISQ